MSHPINVYVREDRVVPPPLDRWLAGLFSPEYIERTLNAVTAAQGQPAQAGMIAAARRELAEADRKLARHRAALEAGADPAIVAGWIKELQAARFEAQSRLQRVETPASTKVINRDELAAMINALGDMVKVLGEAEAERKAKIYAGLGIRLTYHPRSARSWSRRRPVRQVQVWASGSCPRGERTDKPMRADR